MLIDPINENDVIYQDELVCILHPNIKKGIIIWNHYNQPKDMDSLFNLGLKTGKQLQKEWIEFGRSIFHPYIFFKAPYYSREIDYSTPETEINSLFGEGQIGIEPRIFIRVDPNKTYVFSSEIRAYRPENINLSKKTLSEYLKIISINEKLYSSLFPLIITKKQPAYNLYTSRLVLVSNNGIKYKKINYPLNSYPIERNSEILVSIPHLTREFFIL